MKPVDTQWLSRLRAAIDYDADAGTFSWKVFRGHTAKPGSLAGTLDSKGHRQIRFEGRLHLAHRLAWVMVNGKWPVGEIDHVNRVRDDNRIANLRECSHAENSQNRGTYSSNTSGVTGVSWFPKYGKWVAYIRAGKRRHLGYFETFEAAVAARKAAEIDLHAFSAKQGVILTNPEGQAVA
jgi:hypothetical protein